MQTTDLSDANCEKVEHNQLSCKFPSEDTHFYIRWRIQNSLVAMRQQSISKNKFDNDLGKKPAILMQ